MAQPLVRFKKILGIDNTSDLTSDRIKGAGIYLYECDNVDIDDESKPHRRTGDGELVEVGSGKHSGWSDGETFLYVDGTSLKKYPNTTLITGVDPTDRMVYVRGGNQIFFANGSIIGYINTSDGLPYPFPGPAQTFKIRMMGGQALEIYNGRLFAANASNLFFSDATILTRMDSRKNAIAYKSRITMVKAVMDGIYVGLGDAVYFLKGSDPISNFVEIKITDFGAVEGCAITVDDDDIGHGITGRVVYWLSSTGAIYRGLPGGVVYTCQNGSFFDDRLDAGTSILTYDHGYYQYLAVCPLLPGIGGVDGSFRIPRFQMTGTDSV